MGYPFGVKGYRVWIPKDLTCTTSRIVVFKEDEVYKDTLVQQVTDQGKNSEASEKQKKNGKKISFSPSLIRGPSSPDYEHGEI